MPITRLKVLALKEVNVKVKLFEFWQEKLVV